MIGFKIASVVVYGFLLLLVHWGSSIDKELIKDYYWNIGLLTVIYWMPYILGYYSN